MVNPIGMNSEFAINSTFELTTFTDADASKLISTDHHQGIQGTDELEAAQKACHVLQLQQEARHRDAQQRKSTHDFAEHVKETTTNLPH